MREKEYATPNMIAAEALRDYARAVMDNPHSAYQSAHDIVGDLIDWANEVERTTLFMDYSHMIPVSDVHTFVVLVEDRTEFDRLTNDANTARKLARKRLNGGIPWDET